MDAGSLVRPALEVEDLTLRLQGLSAPVLAGATLVLRPGEVIGVLGRPGAGKTTLLHALLGLLPWARPAGVEGRILVDGEVVGDLDPAQRSRIMGAALDRPSAQLFLPTPRQELEAARRHRKGCLQAGIEQILGLAPLLDRRILELSSGERQRLALACALTAAPGPVLLDEPTAHLDEEGVRALRATLALVKEKGGAVLVVEQAGWRLEDTVDRWLALTAGRLSPCAAPRVPRLPAPEALRPPGPPVLELRGGLLARGERTLLEGVDLSLRPGEIVLVRGPNGSGKSTLAAALAGYHRLGAGTLLWQGRPVRPRAVALMLPEAGRQLFATTVAGEVALAGVRRAEAARVLRRHRLDALAGRSPWSLSRGEQQRLLHAALDVTRPALMLLDEPAQGLDPEELSELAGRLLHRAERGRALLIFSHRTELASLAHRRLTIRSGRLEEESP